MVLKGTERIGNAKTQWHAGCSAEHRAHVPKGELLEPILPGLRGHVKEFVLYLRACFVPVTRILKLSS